METVSNNELIENLKPGSRGAAFLNGTRGIAAILVLLGHAKLMLLQDARSIPNVSLIQKAFYFWTNLGDSAVMVFFVLSGFLVGGSVIRASRRGLFSWRSYAAARISRLYTVLIPALVIGAATDLVGLYFLGGASPYSQPKYGFMLPESIGANITPSVFLGNVVFLQEITVSTLGSNGPLWSLTNEAWYYLAFPFLVALFLGGGGLIRKGIFGLLFVSIEIFLPFEIRSLGVVWLMGAVVSAAPARKMPTWMVLLISTAFAATLLAASAGVIQGLGKDYFQGAVFAAVLYAWLPHLKDAANAPARKVTGFLSEISYSLYLFHMPFIVFVAALIVGRGDRFTPTLAACFMVLALSAGGIVYGSLMWCLFERHTATVRRILSGFIS